MNRNQLKQRWFKINAPLGKDLGYPDCCIKAFCDQPPELMTGSPTRKDISRYNAGCINGNFTGFIPCYKHAKQIHAGKTTLHELITDRNPDFLPFPLME